MVSPFERYNPRCSSEWRLLGVVDRDVDRVWLLGVVSVPDGSGIGQDTQKTRSGWVR